MTWCNESQQQEVEGEKERAVDHNIREQLNIVPISTLDEKKIPEMQIVACPSCDHSIQIQDKAGILDLPGLPAGVKFDPSDPEILEHLEAKVLCDVPKLHPLIDEFIPTLEGENGICSTHPEKLPGVHKDGQVRHFFHRPSKAYTTGTRKRRKVHTGDEDGGETRWHKTGKTRPVYVGGALKGFKKILVLYTNYGRQRKPEKTNWVMHQYHIGSNEEEKDGELVVSKVFYQTQPRQCGGTAIKDSFEKRLMNDGNSVDDFSIPKNTAGFIQYYNPSIIVDHGVHDRESPPKLIPNLVRQGDGSSYIRLSMDASKARLEGK